MDPSGKTVFLARAAGDVLVFDIDGELSITASPVPTIHELAKDRLARGTRKLLFNFAKTRFVDSFGVGQLIATYTSTQNLGGAFKLSGLSPQLYAILAVTGIIPRVIKVYPDEQSALASFSAPPGGEDDAA